MFYCQLIIELKWMIFDDMTWHDQLSSHRLLRPCDGSRMMFMDLYGSMWYHIEMGLVYLLEMGVLQDTRVHVHSVCISPIINKSPKLHFTQTQEGFPTKPSSRVLSHTHHVEATRLTTDPPTTTKSHTEEAQQPDHCRSQEPESEVVQPGKIQGLTNENRPWPSVLGLPIPFELKSKYSL